MTLRNKFVRGICFLLCLIIIANFVVANDVYDDFNQFCLDNFGAESDSLYYEVFGEDLHFVESGNWIHESRNSAAIAFETSLPAKSYIEYGLTTAYGQRTEDSDRYYFLHLHHLTGLAPGQTYHYRLVAEDERGITIYSTGTVNTHHFNDAIEIPGSLQGPPYVLDQSGRTYILTEDIVSDTRGITVSGSATGIVFDLNGFMIIYDNGQPLLKPSSPSMHRRHFIDSEVSSVGVHWRHEDDDKTLKILNGAIKQGDNNGAGVVYGVGFNPILGRRGQWTVEGVMLDWSGDNTGGMWLERGSLYAHHNVLLDRGVGITDRHHGVNVIRSWYISDKGWHHNLVKRGRHWGLHGGEDQWDTRHHYKNEFYLDSLSTNAFGLRTAGLVENNWVFGTGCHAQGIFFALYGAKNPIVRNNFIHMQGATPPRLCEDTTHHMGRVVGIRLTQYHGNAGSSSIQENHLYEQNTLIVKVRETAQGHGVRLSAHKDTINCIFRDNVVKLEVQDDTLAGGDHPIRACIVTQGTHESPDPPPVLYENNKLISNGAFIHFADGYFWGGSTHLRNNEFHRFGNRPGHYDIHIGVNWLSPSFNNRIIDASLFGGVDLENNIFDARHNPNRLEYSVGHSLHIIARRSGTGAVIGSKTVVVADSAQIGGFETETNANGRARVELIEYSYVKPPGTAQPSRLTHSSHELRVDGCQPFVITPQIFGIANNVGNPIDVFFVCGDSAYCGDGVCNAGETCESCPEDCGGEEGCENVEVGVCEYGETRVCGPATDVGACEFGVQTCVNGLWGECVGAVYPSEEICDGIDNNCDGIIDEYLLDCDTAEIKPPCSSNWDCSEWGECVSKRKNRSCVDLNECNVSMSRPLETAVCIVATKGTKTDGGGGNIFSVVRNRLFGGDGGDGGEDGDVLSESGLSDLYFYGGFFLLMIILGTIIFMARSKSGFVFFRNHKRDKELKTKFDNLKMEMEELQAMENAKKGREIGKG